MIWETLFSGWYLVTASGQTLPKGGVQILCGVTGPKDISVCIEDYINNKQIVAPICLFKVYTKWQSWG